MFLEFIIIWISALPRNLKKLDYILREYNLLRIKLFINKHIYKIKLFCSVQCEYIYRNELLKSWMTRIFYFHGLGFWRIFPDVRSSRGHFWKEVWYSTVVAAWIQNHFCSIVINFFRLPSVASVPQSSSAFMRFWIHKSEWMPSSSNCKQKKFLCFLAVNTRRPISVCWPSLATLTSWLLMFSWVPIRITLLCNVKYLVCALFIRITLLVFYMSLSLGRGVWITQLTFSAP